MLAIIFIMWTAWLPLYFRGLKIRHCRVTSCIFLVISPLISLVMPCYDFKLEVIYCSVYEGVDSIRRPNFLVNFPVREDFGPEIGRQVTNSSAIQRPAG